MGEQPAGSADDRTGRAGTVGYRLLGAVGAWRDGREVDLGPHKQRAVLATLLLRAGQVVPTRDILHAVWDDEPPADGPNVVSKYVGRLRRRLGGGDALPWAGYGYCVPAGPAALDLAAFEERTARARVHRAAGDLESASRELERADALWTGPALTGLDSPFFDTERDRLGELRLAAVEEHADIDLRLGRHRRWAAELARQVAAHPLRERFAEQLMLALYRCGRQADALSVYRMLRGRLTAELGVEPGPRVARLHQAILRAEPGLDTGAEPEPEPDAGRAVTRPVPEPEPPAPRPHQLPAAIGDFTGRAAELGELRDWLHGPPAEGGRARVAIVTGPGGVGKTSLALQAAHLSRAIYPDGQLYVESAPDTEAADVCARLLRALGVGGAAIPEPAERAALYRTLTSGKRLLLVFDDVASEQQVASLVPADGRSAVLITSRSALSGMPATTRLELGMMPAREAYELLDTVIGAERLSREPEMAEELVRLCGRLPLALRIAAARVAANPHWTIARLVRRLADERRRLDELRHRDLEVRASLNLSYQVLPQRARLLLTRAGLLAVPDIAEWGAAALLDCSIAEAQDVLDQLVAARMMEAGGPGPDGSPRYRLHDLVRLFAQEQAERDLAAAEREAVLDRALGAWLRLAEQADAALPHGSFSRPAGPTPRYAAAPGVEQALLADPLRWFDREHGALETLIGQAAATGRAGAAWELTGSLMAYYEVRAHCTEWNDTHRRALAAVQAAGDRLGTAVVLRGLGELHTLQDRSAAAVDCFTRARALFAELGQTHGVAVCDSGLGHQYRVGGRYEEALQAFGAAARASAAAGYPRTEAYARHCSGVAHLERGELDRAERAFGAALALSAASGYRRGEAQTERGLGLLAGARGDHEAAERHFQRALAVSTELGEPAGTAHVLQMLADARMRRGRLDSVREPLRRALRIYRATGEPFGQALVLQTLAEHQRRLGRPADALEPATASVRLWSAQCAPLWHARALRVLGDVHADLADPAAARDARERALAILAGLGVPEHAEVAELLADTAADV
ncbi:AfsR/SARP family transcriptional regulator [Actinacidiphila sp. ITFR-21]|uniref:AfsR/SARP family transcriptional regulator n=1 Tax=Actinacidiphila sp. ITFR-21 TaxID=3075199 RepID=UPI00288B17E3|nr:BTAD domain-containing putative transcriptional regulator [Streptomyces sp. ITFR-21]WNI14161.1 BTAD domain-containing putative transcriptional regulator [Streptomyces sp. ITFR-21]